MKKYIEKYFSWGVGLLMLACMFFIADKGAKYTAGRQVLLTEGKLCVVLDAGHGGDDPGKIGINGSREKEINLAITHKVKAYLEANDIQVVLTREGDEGLYDANAENKKVQDMKRRIEVVEKVKPAAVISIHQNSYTEEYVKGAQVFFHKDSKEGEKLASLLQESMRTRLYPENHRQIKANDTYYLLKKTQVPTVIVECGFLSNAQEAELLIKDEYQDKVAWAIHMGIVQYLNDVRETNKYTGR